MIFCLRVGCFWAGVVIFISALIQPVVADILETALHRKPDLFVCMDGGDVSEYAIVVEKDTQHLTLFQFDGGYKEVLNVKCSTGEVPGIKTRSGDKKTPEGVYFFTGAFKKKYLSAVYGEMAFPMDYPNLVDRLQGREGNSIWMHGTNKQIKDRDSNGCIVLANADIKKLSKYITINRTPIIVTEKVQYSESNTDQTAKEKLIDFLHHWNETLVNGSHEAYLSFYDQESIPEITWWKEWNAMRKEFQNSTLPVDIRLREISIYKHNGVYTALFEQNIQVGEQIQAAGTRKVYLKVDSDQVQVMGDMYQEPRPASNAQATANPLIRACFTLKAYHYAKQDIEALVDRWLTAWAEKDIETYGDCYASDFRFRWMDRRAWLNKKKRLSQKYKYISVSKENLVIQTGVTKSSATFTQKYESSGYRAVGTKKLIFKREDGQWKIYRERWKKI